MTGRRISHELAVQVRIVPNVRKIDFLIIGAQKSGTTSLHDYLAQHPDIYMPDRKDLPFFIDAGRTEVRERDLSIYYRNHDGEKLIGGSFTQLMFHPEAPGRIAAHNPRMKLVAVLRNPVDRAYSGFWFARREGYENIGSFEEALSREPERLNGNLRDKNELTYLAHGHYAEQLSRFVATFGQSSLRVYLFEDLVQHPEGVVRDLLSWLGLEYPPDFAPFAAHKNPAGLPRSRLLQRTLIVPPAPISALYHLLVPRRLRFLLDRFLISRLRSINTKPFRYPPMAAETRAELAAYFAPHNARLATMLGRDLEAWQ